MFNVSKAMTFLFLPPGLIVLIILATILLLSLALRRQRTQQTSPQHDQQLRRPQPGERLIQTAIVLLALAAVLLYTLSTEPVSELLLRPLERAHPPLVLNSDAGPASSPPSAGSISADSMSAAAVESVVDADAIIVLGAGTVSHSPEEGGRTAPGVETQKRLSFAYRIHRITGLPLITTGGPPLATTNSQPSAPNAGAAMGRYLIALGASPDFVKTEETSRNTYENALHVVEQFGPENAILVTSAYHMPRSVWVFQQRGLQVRPAPTDYKADADGYNLWSFFPTMGSLNDSYKALHEYVGIVYYLLRFRGIQ